MSILNYTSGTIAKVTQDVKNCISHAFPLAASRSSELSLNGYISARQKIVFCFIFRFVPIGLNGTD